MEGYKPKTEKKEETSLPEKGWRSLMALTLAGALGAETVSNFVYERPRNADYQTDWEGIEKQTHIDLKPLEAVANAKIEIIGGRYFIHVAQMHGANSLETTKNALAKHGVPLEKLIECQKQVEATLTFLKDKQYVDGVFLEGMIPEDVASYAKVRGKIAEKDVAAGHDLHMQWKQDAAQGLPKEFDEYRALDLIAAAKLLEGTAEGDAVKEDPLIAGDMQYVWGGAHVAAVRDGLPLYAAEDPIANARAVEVGLTSDEGHHVREEAALNLMLRQQQPTAEKSAAFVYGAAHDFSQVVRERNEKSQTDFGLIRIDPHACNTDSK